MKFEIFYEDNSIITGCTGTDWVNAPYSGVQAVIVENNDKSQECIYAVDYYILTPNKTIVGLDYKVPGYVKEGTLLPYDKYRNIIDNMIFNSNIWDNA